MSDETRAKLLELHDEARNREFCDCTLCEGEERERTSVFESALTAHEQAVAAEAVLAFARGPVNIRLDQWSVVAADLTQQAREFIQAQGWSETPGQAERFIA